MYLIWHINRIKSNGSNCSGSKRSMKKEANNLCASRSIYLHFCTVVCQMMWCFFWGKIFQPNHHNFAKSKTRMQMYMEYRLDVWICQAMPAIMRGQGLRTCSIKHWIYSFSFFFMLTLSFGGPSNDVLTCWLFFSRNETKKLKQKEKSVCTKIIKFSQIFDKRINSSSKQMADADAEATSLLSSSSSYNSICTH